MDEHRAAARRQFLKLSGFGLAGAAALAACSNKSHPYGDAGTTEPPNSSTTAIQAPPLDRTQTDIDNDKAQMRTLTSLELLVVDVYNQSEQYLSPEAAQLGRRFWQQHQDHARQLQALTRTAFSPSTAYDKPNQDLIDTVVKPTMDALVSASKNAGSDATAQRAAQAGFVRFLVDMENTSAASAVVALGVLSLPTLRHPVGAISASSARRAAVYDNLLGATVPDVAFFAVESAAPIDALIK